MNECIFCNIIEGKIPSTNIFENETVFAFLDIKPTNIGHALVVPKKHYTNIFDIPEEMLCEVMRVVKKLSPIIKEAVGADGINIIMNNERAAGQLVFHSHTHIVPRFLDDGFTHWKGKRPYKDGEMEEVAEKIKSLLIRV